MRIEEFCALIYIVLVVATILVICENIWSMHQSSKAYRQKTGKTEMKWETNEALNEN